MFNHILRELLISLERAQSMIDVNIAAGEARQAVEDLLKTGKTAA